jgi:pSer/pThr/pTyr-binding forkhead associated (FHA) protein
MPPVVLLALQGVFLVLLYLFLARAVRAVVVDVLGPKSGRRGAGQRRPERPAPPPEREREQKPRSRPRELVVHTPGGKPQVVALDGGQVTLGRDAKQTVPLDDAYVSEHHARVYADGDEWFVADVGSTNGTYLNKSRLTRDSLLSAGDQMGLGKTVVEVRR